MPAYPTAGDLLAWQTEAGMVTTNMDLIPPAAAAGIAAFERDTGRKMLAGAPSLRTFNPVGLVVFDADLAGTATVELQPEGSSAQALTEGTQYLLGPYNAAAEGKPYEWLELRTYYLQPYAFNSRRALRVTGAWGFGTTIPEDAWHAMLLGGFLFLWDLKAIRLVGFATGWREADVAVDYAPQAILSRAEGFRTVYAAAVDRYRKGAL